MTEAEKRLSKYDNVLTVSVNLGGRMATVPVYKIIEKFIYTENENGETVKLIMREDQINLYEEMCQSVLRKKAIRENILKARQIGFSTFIAAVIFVVAYFTPGIRAGIVADTQEHANNLFRKYQFYFMNLPDELKLPLLKNNANELMFEQTKNKTSSIKVMVQGNNAGRSGTFQLLHLSEIAFWEDIHDTVVSLLATCPTSNLKSMIFFETTANGYNDYKKRWDNDISTTGTDEEVFKALFYPWYGTSKYSTPYRGFQLLPFEEELVEKCKLSLDQIQWYHDMYISYSKDLEKLRQEYPSTPSEAFITSGNSVFDQNLLKLRKDQLIEQDARGCKNKRFKCGFYTYETTYSPDGQNIDIANIQFHENNNGALKIYVEPDRTHPYVVNLDPAQGGVDSYAIQVMDNYTGEQVAVFNSPRCQDDEVGFILYCLGKKYNNALISSETNTTALPLQVLSKLGYRNIAYDKDYEDLNERWQARYGYRTKSNNRNVMIQMLKIHFKENYNKFNDLETLNQMENFQIVKNNNTGKEKQMAIAGQHDDLVMAFAGLLYIRDQQSYLPFKAPPQTELEDDTENPFKRSKNKNQVVKGAFIQW